MENKCNDKDIATLKEGEPVPEWMVHRVIGNAIFEYKYFFGLNELLIVLPDVSDDEITAVKHGSMAFGLFPYKSVIFFLYVIRKGNDLSEVILFGDCPYSIHNVPPEHRAVPSGTEGAGMMQVVLVEKNDRVLKATRSIGLAGGFTNVLYDLIKKQAESAFDPATHDNEVKEIQEKFQTALDMMPFSPIVCTIKENE